MADVDPYTQEQWATVACGGKADADRAIAAARKAFDEGPWPRMGFEKRQEILHRLADLMDEHADELAMADTRDMGKPITQARHDVARSSWNFRFFADHARMTPAEALPMDSGHHAYTRFEPAGVFVAISPWNFPLMLGTWKIAPALAWGNTVVWKPAEDTPVSATIVGRLALEAGMPPGVLNVVHGYGPNSAGSALTESATSIASPSPASPAPARSSRGVAAEPGAGQPRARRQGREHRLRRCRDRQRRALGGPGDLPQRRPDLPVGVAAVPAVRDLRPVPRQVQGGRRGDGARRPEGAGHASSRSRWPARSTSQGEGLPRRARARGGKILTGGVGEGWSVKPTIIVDAPPTAGCAARRSSARCARSSSSTPRRRRSFQANNTRYGLNAMVFTENLSRAHRVAAQLKAGSVWVNCFFIRDLRAPFGGVGESGVGREGGNFSREFCTEPKAVIMQIDPA